MYGASLFYPLIRARQQTLNISSYLDVVNTRVVQSSGVQQDKLRILRAGADYALEDLLAGLDRSAINTANVRLSQGIPFLGGSNNSNPEAQRPGEDYGFTKFAFDVSRTQTLFQPWSDATIAFKARVTGQGSGNILPPAEKFFLGGPEFDRGYYAGQVTGDSAIAYTAELQLNTSFDFALFGRTLNVGTQFYGFYDYGQVFQNARQEPNLKISSEGIGTKISVTRYTEFDLEGDIRNNRLPIGTAPAVKPMKADALYWRVLTRF